MFNKQAESLVLLVFLKKKNDPEWESPPFTHPNQVCFLSDFMNLNNQLKHEPYPIHKINGIILKLEGFKYVTFPNLNTGY